MSRDPLDELVAAATAPSSGVRLCDGCREYQLAGKRIYEHEDPLTRGLDDEYDEGQTLLAAARERLRRAIDWAEDFDPKRAREELRRCDKLLEQAEGVA